MSQDRATHQGKGLVEQTLPDLDHVSASVYARDCRTGETLVAHDQDVPMLPASNAKLVTAALGFAELEPTYRFKTTVHATGEVCNGHLVGDLVVTGGGAPDLSQADLMELAEGVREAGIETVAGELIVDASAFDERSLGPGWTWDDGQFVYGAKSTPLALERNTVEITIAHRNGSIQVDASPTSNIIRLAVDVDVKADLAADDGANLSVYKERASEVIRVEGFVPPESTTVEASPVDDPMMHAGHVFKDALEKKGVAVDGWIRIEHEPVSTLSAPHATVTSAPLTDLVRNTLTHSDNFAAEQLARTIARESNGTGSWEAWSDRATSFFDDRGVSAVHIYDGSGLSRYNLLSASSIVATLEWCLNQPWGEQYRDSLPETGVGGTVEARLDDLPDSITVLAKTGTLTGVRTLSGYVLNDGRPAIVFSCLLSNLTDEYEKEAVNRIDAFVRKLATSAGFGD